MLNNSPTSIDCISSRALSAKLLSQEASTRPRDPWDECIGDIRYWVERMAEPSSRCRAWPLLNTLRSTKLPSPEKIAPSSDQCLMLRLLHLVVSAWQKPFSARCEFCDGDEGDAVKVMLSFGLDSAVKDAIRALGLKESFHHFELVFRATGLRSGRILGEAVHDCDLLREDEQQVVLALSQRESELRVEVRHGLGLRAVCMAGLGCSDRGD